MAPENLRLDQASDGSLSLAWNRPTNMPNEVNVTYIIIISSIEENETKIEATCNTSALFFSIDRDRHDMCTDIVNNTMCRLFQFTIQGENLAGTGHTSVPIIDTLPICKQLLFSSIYII